ncbi:MAG: GDSL-type esterase/lipase family protein [Saprospiraceae bacterium]
MNSSKLTINKDGTPDLPLLSKGLAIEIYPQKGTPFFRFPLFRFRLRLALLSRLRAKMIWMLFLIGFVTLGSPRSDESDRYGLVGAGFTSTSDFRLPTSDLQLPASNFQLPTSDFRLPTFNFRPSTPNLQLSTSDLQLLTFNLQLPTSDFQLPTSQDSLPAFIDQSVNQILFPEELSPFLEKLKTLESKNLDRITVAHIGDSHIQADYFTGELRHLLQERFGAAGRGFIFPYRQADTNSPRDLTSGSDGVWDFRRNIYDRSGLPIGLAGMSIQTRKTDFTLAIGLKKDSLFDYAFDKINFFYQQGPDFVDYKLGYFQEGVVKAQAVKYTPSYHVVKSGETLSGIAQKYRCSVRNLQSWNRLSGSLIRVGQRLVVGNGGATASFANKAFKELVHIEQPPAGNEPGHLTFYADQPFDELVIKGLKRNDRQRKALIYGMSVEKARQPGLIYHSIGVNGASFYHYNRSEYFSSQLPGLTPDLLVVSLGTNEALSSGFKREEFQAEVAAFLATVREKCPDAAILITTNPDALKRGVYGKTTNPIAREVLIEAAQKYGAAVWDLQAIMLVSGGVRKWQAEGLSGRDLIHFTRKGYELQGELLYQALMNTFELHR